MADPVAKQFADVLAAPLGEVIAAVGRGVAEAQAALDAGSIRATLDLYQDDQQALLQDIGYQPTFYTLPETVCEVQVSMTVSGSQGAGAAVSAAPIARASQAVLSKAALPALALTTHLRPRTYVTPVDAGFQQKYGYSAQGATKLTFKIVPVPPPTVLEADSLRGLRSVPDLVGLSLQQALDYLQRLDLQARVTDGAGKEIARPTAVAATVAAQDVAADRLLPSGSTLTLTVALAV